MIKSEKEISNFICDSHIHVGKWVDGFYFSPEDVADDLLKLGILKWAVSSTSTSDTR